MGPLRLRLEELPSIQLLTFHKEKEMVAFRTLSRAFAVTALLLGSVSAYAQGSNTPFTCRANSGVAPTVRAEGLTELLGDLVLTCTGGNPAAPFLVNFQIFLNTNVTSRLYSDGTYDALLMIDEPGTPYLGGPTVPFCPSPATANNSTNGITGIGTTAPGCNAFAAGSAAQSGSYNVFRGIRPTVSPETSVVWSGIPVQPPGSNTRTFRFVNLRGNASSIGATSSGLPNQIIAFISTNPQNTIAVDNPQQTVGFVQSGMVFDTRNCNNSGGVNQKSFFQCTALNQDRFNTPTSGTLPSNSGSGNSIIGLRFREGFQTAFKVRGATGQESSLPGQVFNSESGFVNPAVAGPGGVPVGVADSGTRLMARFSNIPAGVAMFVSTTNVPFASFNGGSTTGSTAVLVNADASGASFTNGSLPFAASAPTAVSGPITLSCAAGPYTVPAIQIPTSSGSGTAVWEVTAADQSNLDTMFFAIGFAYVSSTSSTTPTPGLGQSTVTGTFAPMYTAAAAGSATFAPQLVPRFSAGTATAQNLFAIATCQSNLLFPFVTNQAGFDTGIAIANTSLDPFGTSPAGGNCTLNYYGSLPNGQPLTSTSERTTSAIQGGQTLTMVLSTGGNFGTRGNPNMQGYIIAQCDFLYAHGFAFITDGPIGQARVAEGYLALVLDAVSTTSRTTATGESLAQ